MAETQTAYAKSAFSDPINIINFLALAFTLPAINSLVSPKYTPLIDAIVALLNLSLRTLFVTHPVAIIAPGEVKPVEVKKLEATKPGTEETSKLPQAVQDKTAVPPAEPPKP